MISMHEDYRMMSFFPDNLEYLGQLAHTSTNPMGLKNPLLALRATPMGVAIKGVIPITAKMAPQRQIIKLQWRWHKRWQNAIQGFGVAYLATLERK